MKISVKQYAQVLLEISRGKEGKELSQAIKSFAQILSDHNQISKIERILDRFINIWEKENAFVRTEILSANKLSDDVLDLLKKYVKRTSRAKDLELSVQVDKDILGGVIIKYDDHIFDASLRTKLKSLKETIKN